MNSGTVALSAFRFVNFVNASQSPLLADEGNLFAGAPLNLYEPHLTVIFRVQSRLTCTGITFVVTDHAVLHGHKRQERTERGKTMREHGNCNNTDTGDSHQSITVAKTFPLRTTSRAKN